ncbi:MAG: UTP--glucose-1-phosphate uridylyltransferase GalU [Dehalococcoidia bacterium]|nr:UTP--glucose-1-phosphate uridylyltransferase GalU [Dehalococcoidia bacterium]
MEIRKAVMPAGGWGTRFLPATKAIPKEMLPLADKPMIQHVVEEAVASGIKQIIIVTSSGKSAIEDHFERNVELESMLQQKGESELLEEVRRIAALANIHFVRQAEPRGLGHAILATRELVGDEPFAVFLPDDIFDAEPPLMKQMLEVYRQHQGSVIALRRVAKEDTRRYGMVKPQQVSERVYRILDMVEKPAPEEAPSDLAILGRYILTPEIFAALRVTPPGKGGEIQLTDGLALLLKQQAIYGYAFDGTYYDAGKPLGLLKASVSMGIRHPGIGADFREYLKKFFEESGD